MEHAPSDPQPYLMRNQLDERLGAGPSRLIRNHREALRCDPSLDASRLAHCRPARASPTNRRGGQGVRRLSGEGPEERRGPRRSGPDGEPSGKPLGGPRQFPEVVGSRSRGTPSRSRELGLIEARDGDLPSALRRFQAAVASSPFDPVTHFNYARLLRQAGDATRADEETAATARLRAGEQRISELRSALAARPDDADLRAEAAKWLIEQGHDAEGLAWTELVLASAPGIDRPVGSWPIITRRRGTAGSRTTTRPRPRTCRWPVTFPDAVVRRLRFNPGSLTVDDEGDRLNLVPPLPVPGPWV